MWTLEVHDVLEANQFMVKQFLAWYIKTKCAKQGRKFVSFEDVIEDMMKSVPKGYSQTIQQEAQMLDEQFILCFANSKFLVIDEMTDAAQLMLLKYDEFLEFIARVAELAKFSGPAHNSEAAEGGEESAADKPEDEVPAVA